MRLKPLADGKTKVALKKEIYRTTFDFVSKVNVCKVCHPKVEWAHFIKHACF